MITLISVVNAGNPVSVPLDHPVYQFLDRMETMGALDNLRDAVKPFDREELRSRLAVGQRVLDLESDFESDESLLLEE